MRKIIILIIVIITVVVAYNAFNKFYKLGAEEENEEIQKSSQQPMTQPVIPKNNQQNTIKSNLIQDQYWRTIMDLYSKIAHSCINLDYENKSNIMKIKGDIKYYKSEIEKTKLDMLKYFNGNPPEQYYRDLIAAENKYLDRYSQCIERCNY